MPMEKCIINYVWRFLLSRQVCLTWDKGVVAIEKTAFCVEEHIDLGKKSKFRITNLEFYFVKCYFGNKKCNIKYFS
jgi:hypothetical protein